MLSGYREGLEVAHQQRAREENELLVEQRVVEGRPGGEGGGAGGAGDPPEGGQRARRRSGGSLRGSVGENEQSEGGNRYDCHTNSSHFL